MKESVVERWKGLKERVEVKCGREVERVEGKFGRGGKGWGGHLPERP